MPKKRRTKQQRFYNNKQKQTTNQNINKTYSRWFEFQGIFKRKRLAVSTRLPGYFTGALEPQYLQKVKKITKLQ